MIGDFLMLDTFGSRVHLMYLPLLEDLSETFNTVGDPLWWQHLITTNIFSHATNVIRSMLDRLRIYQIPDIARARVPLICFAVVE
ncbi:hypothetical protein Lal_00033351 [Lupinus albus]|nr:hypothetical protein Lal_00033351 [Lupinus albus]